VNDPLVVENIEILSFIGRKFDFFYYRYSIFRGRSQITSRFRGRGVEEFVTVQTKNVSFFEKFVTRGERGFEKVVFLRDVIWLFRTLCPPCYKFRTENNFFSLACYKIVDPLPPKSERNK